MKNIKISTDGCADYLFDYPCIDSNDKYLKGKKISLFTSGNDICQSWFIEKGGMVFQNPQDRDVSFTNIGIVCPNVVNHDTENDYFEILNYYVEKLQLLVHKMKGLNGFKHLIVVLPSCSNECSTSYTRMAYYAIYGLIKGLGKIYAPYGLFINGIVLNKVDKQLYLKDRVLYLSSDNSCNTVGQVFVL